MSAFTITALKNHINATEEWQDCYCYDDSHVKAEPLVPETTEVIDKLFTWQGIDAPEMVRIDFGQRALDLGETHDTNDEFVIVYLNSAQTENNGTSYIVNPLYPQRLEDIWCDSAFVGEPPLVAWLCSHLCDYFPKPPEEFFAKITILA